MIEETKTRLPALAATVHDPHCRLLAGLRRVAEPLREVFGGLGILATTPTADGVVAFLRDELDAAVVQDSPGAGKVGKHRREAVRAASTFDPSVILHSDLDHVLRWIETDKAELTETLADLPAEFVVIGRTPRSMNACPQRLQDTEAIVNHIYRLATGRPWDLMFAVRAMSPRAAAVVIEHGSEDTIANDVEWPVLVEQAGLSVGYREADGLSYRITTEFDAAADSLDDDPIAWIHRVELANLQAQTLKRLLAANPI